MPDSDFLPVIMGTALNAYNLARSIHQVYGVKSLALGRFGLRETADSRIVEVRTSPEFGDEVGIMQTLRAVAAEFPDRKLLLIPTIEFYANVVIDNRKELEKYYQVPLVNADLAARLMNKTDFYRTCAELGVPHPETVIVTPDQAEDPRLGEDLPFDFPVILKPSDTDVYPRLKFDGRQKVYLLNDAAEIRAVAQKIFAAGYDADLILQEYLSGDESVMRVANTYSDRNGKMQFLSIGQVVLAEYNPTLVGNNNAIVTIDDPELGESIRRLLDGVGYVGAANLDIMIDQKTGVSKILEVNLRTGASSFYTMAAGGNIASYYVEDHIFNRPLAPFTTTAERLWLNLPFAIAARYAPESTRPLLLAAARHGVWHTLKYPPDMSSARRLDIARLDARRTLDCVKYAGTRLNK